MMKADLSRAEAEVDGLREKAKSAAAEVEKLKDAVTEAQVRILHSRQ